MLRRAQDTGAATNRITVVEVYLLIRRRYHAALRLAELVLRTMSF
ncbi:MAG: hypothetical protein ACRDQ5_08290 [Sciscionella sp.]